MTTFDELLPVASAVLTANRTFVDRLEWLLINRDLNSRVRLIAPATVGECDAQRSALVAIAEELSTKFGPHAYVPESMVLYESEREIACRGASSTATR